MPEAASPPDMDQSPAAMIARLDASLARRGEDVGVFARGTRCQCLTIEFEPHRPLLRMGKVRPAGMCDYVHPVWRERSR